MLLSKIHAIIYKNFFLGDTIPVRLRKDILEMKSTEQKMFKVCKEVQISSESLNDVSP